jgi:predicted GIY-YIG superfamily endonuclease
MDRQYFVYIMTNKHNNVLYTGITNDLKRRVYEHKEKLVGGFTKKYNITKLICRVGGGRASSPFSVRLVKIVHDVPNFQA